MLNRKYITFSVLTCAPFYCVMWLQTSRWI